ncbi:Single Ig IL-1-related receptor [Plecturocebus cupreus]
MKWGRGAAAVGTRGLQSPAMPDVSEENVALELINCPSYKLRLHQHSYLCSTVILVLTLLMISCMIGTSWWSTESWPLHSSAAWRCPSWRSREAQDLLVTGEQVPYPLLHAAVLHPLLLAHLHRLHPGQDQWPPGEVHEPGGLVEAGECQASGCMMDLFVQMAIIMGLKQTLSNWVEYLGPWLVQKWHLKQASAPARDPELRNWQRNYLLNPVNTFSLFDEFMEMNAWALWGRVIQYGFTTIFVAAFPLAPLLALFSNLVEIHLDAIKMVRLQRRLMPCKAKDIVTAWRTANDRDLPPRIEPSADLLENLSLCQRLFVVLSDAFLSRAWCNHSFPEGLWWLLELTCRPIFITFEGERHDPTHPALSLLRQHLHLVTLLLWRPGSMPGPQTPSSDFWKELQLVLPRKVHYRPVEGDPQTQLQYDKNSMLILQGRAPEGRALDEGDLGVLGPVFGEPSAPPSTGGVLLGEGPGSEVDVLDLGS